MSEPAKTVDARGLPCPQPVVLVRKAILEPGTESVRVLIDNPISVENVRRMAQSQGWDAAIESRGEETHMLLTPAGAAQAAAPEGAATDEAPLPAGPPAAPPPRVAVLISSDLFGTGEEELGRILMRAFVKTIKDLDPLPEKIIFVNSGVRLSTEGSDLIDDLVFLANTGVDVVSCGTCLDYYKLVDALKVGRVTNMYEIASSLAAADRVVRP